MSDKIPSREQIQRLINLQGTDAGVFTLAVFSTIEAYLRSVLGSDADEKTSFYKLLMMYRDDYSSKHQKIYKLCREINENQYNTNKVRHQFKALSVEEANSAVHLLYEFAQLENIPNNILIPPLLSSLDSWKSRLSPSETARELERVRARLETISAQNMHMAERVVELEGIKVRYDVIAADLMVKNARFDEEILKNKANKEKIDELRRKKHEAEQEASLARKELQRQLSELADAEEYIASLSRMSTYTRTRYDYEQSLLRLTKEQESIVNMVKFDRDFLIKGSAGTGKSLVLLNTLAKLVKENATSFFNGAKRIRLITFTHSLEKYSRYVADLMNIQHTLEDGIICTSESYINKLLSHFFPGILFTYDIKEGLPQGFLCSGSKSDVSVFTELERFILPNYVTHLEYCNLKIERIGMKKAAGEKERRDIWGGIEEIFNVYESSAARPAAYGIYKIALMLDSGEAVIPDSLCTDFLFIDEAQDLSAAALKILRSTVKESMILAGDNDQSVFQPKFSWKRAGINISGNSRTLNINFRSTNQIHQAAEKYRRLIKGCEKDHRPETFRLGPPVELHENDNAAESLKEILSSVSMFVKTLRYEPENICIIAPKRDFLQKVQLDLAEELSLPSDFVNSPDFDFAQPGIVRLATTQSCKGLDFPVVLFYLDHRARFLEVYDDATADKMNRNMIYTAMTRSVEILHVFMLRECTAAPIIDLKNILKNQLPSYL
ncbi:MAG TPA: UvrD-helicase domain-containing protein [Treponemataceae bacterium]|nr:UvrD-helicase domain-containing protein [Treponemataceae bacterium]